MKKSLEKVKTDIKQGVTSLNLGVKVSKSNTFFGRYVPVTSMFEVISIDNFNHYEFKNLDLEDYWYNSTTMKNLYKYNSTFMGLYFRNTELPKRCEDQCKTLVKDYTNWLRYSKGKTKVSTVKVRLIVRHLLKHISRLYYHKKFCIQFPKRDSFWKEDKRLSVDYMKYLVEFLKEKELIKEFTGYKDYDKYITTLLVIKPDFIEECNGKVESNSLDECLKVTKTKPLVSITEKLDKKTKVKRKMTKEEKSMSGQIEEVLTAYNELLSNKMITVNGVNVPEIFFTRVFSNNMHQGGRFYDNGDIQQEPKLIRDTILIDQEETVEVDYAGLHYAIAAEKLGINLSHKDPYSFEYHVDIDRSLVSEWEDKVGAKLPYDPVRNIKKTAMLIMFNSSSDQEAVKAISNALISDYKKKDPLKRRLVGIKGLKVTPLIAAIKANNKEVSQFFNSSVWGEFQNLDSQMMDYCVKSFMKSGEVCIPIHDSLVVKKTLQETAVSVMEEAFRHVMGSNLNCKVK